MFCENCGTKALDDAKFCQKCGASLEDDFSEQKNEQKNEQKDQDVLGSQTQVSSSSCPNENNTGKKGSKKIWGILGTIALIIVVVIIYEVFYATGIDYIATVKSSSPFDKNGIQGTYKEVLDKYLDSSDWKVRKSDDIHYVDINGTIKGTNHKLAMTIEVMPDSDNDDKVWIKPKTVVLDDDKPYGESETDKFLFSMFMVHDQGCESLSELMYGTQLIQTSSNIKLSKIYTNEEEGISFKYPDKWIYFSEDELASYEVEGAKDALIGLRNEFKDVPQATILIGVTKLSATQDEIDLFFTDDEQFADMFKSAPYVSFLLDTSITKIDGIVARKVTYIDNDNARIQSYFYVDDSVLYQVHFECNSKFSYIYQRYFEAVSDAVIRSYKITSSNKKNENSTVESKSGSINSDFISVEEAEKLIYDWIEAGHKMGYVCYPEYTGEGKLNINGIEVYNFNLFVSRAAWLPIMVEKNTGNLLTDFDGKIITLDDYYNNYYLELMDVRSESELYVPTLDKNLIGRWRSYDGKKLTFSEGGEVSDFFVFWNGLNRQPNYVGWEAANGRIILTAYRNSEYKYSIGEGKRYVDGLEVETDELKLGKFNVPEASEYGDFYRIKEGNSKLEGTWIAGENTLSGNYIFYDDGTGMIGNNDITWSAEDNTLQYTSEEKAYFDYTVNGNILTLFFSNGSEIFTKVGN